MIREIHSEACTGCGICIERCPLDTLRLNVFVKETPPCQDACPAKVDIRGYIYFLRQGEFKKAIELLREQLPFPAITGRVCFHPCERKCARREVDEPVNIKSLERFIADYWLGEKPNPWPRIHAGKIAVIGSGAGGLSAAYFLKRMGYGVTVFESKKEIGGMLRTNISEILLPREILEAQINYIKEMGIEFELNTPIGDKLNINDLRDKGYNIIFLAIGDKLSEISSLLRGLTGEQITLKIDPITFQTNIPYVFAGGSLAIGKSPLVKVIASSKIAAQAIDRFIKNGELKPKKRERILRVKKIPKAGIKEKKRVESRNGFNEEEALDEAQRCMTCGGEAYIAYPDDCMTCFECELQCPSGAIDVHPFKEKLPPTI